MKIKKTKMIKKTKEKETAPCPDCEGTGTVVSVRIEPICCGNLDKNGGCCNYPIPDQVAEPEQCERCEVTGQVPEDNTKQKSVLK